MQAVKRVLKPQGTLWVSGTSHSIISKASNGLLWELKSLAFHTVKDELAPKEIMAITMVNPEELKAHSFFESHCWAKLKAIVFCTIERDGKNAESDRFLKVESLDFAEDDELIQEIKADYDFIRNKLITQGFEVLTGAGGKWMQARTKGAWSWLCKPCFLCVCKLNKENF